MTLFNILTLIGLLLNIAASLIMLYPYLNIKKNTNGDFIASMNKETGDYT
jgi:hypothetical protein